MTSDFLRIALCQLNPRVADFSNNTKKILENIDLAMKYEPDLIVLPELVICGYSPEDLLLIPDFVRFCEDVVDKVMKHVPKDVPVILGSPYLKGKKVFNSMVFIHNGMARYVYDKVRLPNFGVFDEKRYFEAGNRLFTVVPSAVKKTQTCGVTICRDIWEGDFVDYVVKKTKKIDCLINISASPYYKGKPQEIERMLKKYCRKYGVSVVYCNLVGGQDEVVFFGGSVVLDPKGKFVMRAPLFKEGVYVAELPLKRNSIAPSYYGVNFIRKDETVTKEIYDLIVLGIKDYIIKTGNKTVVLGLSGGIDSALVCSLAVEALGTQNVTALFLPSKFTAKLSRDIAYNVANQLGVKIIEIKIDPIFKKITAGAPQIFDKTEITPVEENLQSRIRGLLLMGYSNKTGALVLATGNKSELATGYATLYGDMVGAYAPIKDLYKKEVYELASFYNKLKGSDIIPRSCFTREPTAELRKGQLDRDTLPKYSILDEILMQIIEQKSGIKKILKEMRTTNGVVGKVVSMIRKSEFKRRQAPIGVKVSKRAFGKDWRYPISSGDWIY